GSRGRSALKERRLRFIAYFNEVFAKPFRWTFTGRPLQTGGLAKPGRMTAHAPGPPLSGPDRGGGGRGGRRTYAPFRPDPPGEPVSHGCRRSGIFPADPQAGEAGCRLDSTAQDCLFSRVSRTFGETGLTCHLLSRRPLRQLASNTRCRSKSNFARPNICRLIIFNRFT